MIIMKMGMVCTVSPKTIPFLGEMKRNGMSIIRVNGSFGIPDIDKLKAVGLPILLDIPGERKKKRSNGMTDDELLLFAVRNGLDFVGLSYVKSKRDIEIVRKKLSNSNVKIVGKVETEEAVKEGNLIPIIMNSDMILIDRGDLGTAIGFEKVPYYQCKIVKLCNTLCKEVIVATEMFMSTINTDKPNCADVSDVFYALSQGATYVMLSEETAIGDNPTNSVRNMRRVIDYVKENSLNIWSL
jgi:pyruvate kinase